MAPFEHGAQVLASLNRPNIAAIYTVEQGAIVLELAPVGDLKGPIPLDTALHYAGQIAGSPPNPGQAMGRDGCVEGLLPIFGSRAMNRGSTGGRGPVGLVRSGRLSDLAFRAPELVLGTMYRPARLA